MVGSSAGAVSAQEYPGTTSTTTTVPPAAVVSQVSGTARVGETTTVVSCGFAPSVVGVAVNGQSGPNVTAARDGCARVAVAVLGSHLVRVEGAELPARCGEETNTVSVSGTGSTGAPRVVSTAFGIECAQAGTLLPRTGALILRWSLLGGALAAVGVLLVLANRRPQPQSAADQAKIRSN